MSSTALSPRVVALSWATALLVWPAVWWSLTAAQGLGVLLQGGDWIGLAVPLGASPWGLVNEPGIAFAISRGALFGYWLAPLLAAAVIALLVPPLLPGGGGWSGELVVFHVAFACSVLGLAWAPALGLEDGAAAGLERFWEIDPRFTVAACLLLAVLSVQAQAPRLGASLWDSPGGPLRRRRVAVALVHGAAPAGAWYGMTVGTGWRPPLVAAATAAAVVLALVASAWFWVPRHPRVRRRNPGPLRVLGTAGLGVVTVLLALWFGSPAAGHPQAVLWAREGTTSNVRANMEKVSLRPRRARSEPPEPSAPGS